MYTTSKFSFICSSFKGAHIYYSALFFSIFVFFITIQKDAIFPKATAGYRLAQGQDTTKKIQNFAVFFFPRNEHYRRLSLLSLSSDVSSLSVSGFVSFMFF